MVTAAAASSRSTDAGPASIAAVLAMPQFQ
jgi:hypothetical protein